MASRERPLASLMTQVFSEAAYLLQTEIRLARAEIGEKLGRAAHGGVLIGIGAVVLLPGLFVLLLSAVRWLEVAGLPQQWGLLLVGIVAVAVGAALTLTGAKSVQGPSLVPDRTIHQVRADISVVKEHI